MKLFTIFKNDQRALEYITADPRRIQLAIKRVTNHHEWGVRLLLPGTPASSGKPARLKTTTDGRSGATYLERKKAQRDAAVELIERAPEVSADLYDVLEERASLAKRRSVAERASKDGPLLLDAVFL